MTALTRNLPSESRNKPIMDQNDSDPYEGWIPTPPSPLGDDDNDLEVTADCVLDPMFKDFLVSPCESSLDEISRLAPRRCSVTPLASQPACKQQRSAETAKKKSSSHPFESPDSAGTQEGLGPKSLMSHMPTKEKNAESQNQLVFAQEQMTYKMTEAMTKMITSNQNMEISEKKELALEGLKYKTRLA